ncbi:MAG: oligopeptide/dipeptide ABC transporter ATP-binding protein, partial [Nevskiales bacterium]
MTPLLDVAALNVAFPALGGLHPVRDVAFTLHPGETLGIVGESGSGKSLTALSLLALLPPRAQRHVQRLAFDGDDLSGFGERRMADIRGRRISMIFQDPMTSLNPAYTIGNQLQETYLRHVRATPRQARERAAELLEQVGITAVRERLAQYPHQLSGGLRQRVMIAMALICEPDLLIADEPTTALDVTVQAGILHLLMRLQQKFRMALILITHDLGIVARIAQRIMVMYAGQIVETAPTAELFTDPRHPYTRALLDCIPVPGRTARGAPLGSIPGLVPNLVGDLGGCHFRNRCAHAHAACAASPIELRPLDTHRAVRCVLPAGSIAPALRPSASVAAEDHPPPAPTPLLEMRDAGCIYRVPSGMFRPRRSLHAVDGVSLTLHQGEVVGLVGE